MEKLMLPNGSLNVKYDLVVESLIIKHDCIVNCLLLEEDKLLL